MNRSDLQRISRLRLREAKALHQVAHFSGAYYLAGYAVECALKSCIARQTQRHEFPDKKRVMDSHTHNLVELMRLAKLDGLLLSESAAHPSLGLNWSNVKRWNEASRYELHTEADSSGMIQSVSARGGLLPWITRRW